MRAGDDLPAGARTAFDARTQLDLRSALRRFDRESEETCRGLGISGSQFHVLLAAARDHRPSIGDISRFLQVKPSTAVGLVEGLRRMQLVRRIRDTADRRVSRVGLTDRGASALAQLIERHAPGWERLSATFALDRPAVEGEAR